MRLSGVISLLAVTGQNAVHDPADGLGLPLESEMKMVSHQTVCVKKERKLLLLYGQQCKKSLMILRRMKDVPPVHSPRDQVIETTLDL
jgi:hypothetical protein